MLDANISEYVNGFSVTVYDKGAGFIVREVMDTRLEALRALHNAIADLMVKEREGILNAAMQ